MRLNQLLLADAEYIRAAGGAGSLCRRPPVLKGDRPGVSHLNFLPAFHAIGLHLIPPKLSLPSRVTKLSVFVNSCRHKFIVF